MEFLDFSPLGLSSMINLICFRLLSSSAVLCHTTQKVFAYIED